MILPNLPVFQRDVSLSFVRLTHPQVIDQKKNKPQVCAADADVTFQSADGVLFHLHRKNLDTRAGGFAPPGFETQGKTVKLTEHSNYTRSSLSVHVSSTTSKSRSCSILRPFITCRSCRKVRSLHCYYPVQDTLHVHLSIFHLLIHCLLIFYDIIRSILPYHADDIMEFAAKHDHLDVLDAIAPMMIDRPLQEMANKLLVHLFRAWVGNLFSIPPPDCLSTWL